MPALFICPKCQTSFLEGREPIDRVLLLHKKTCGHLPLRFSSKEPTSTVRATSQDIDQTADRVVNQLLNAAGKMLKKGVDTAVRKAMRRRR